MRSMSVLLGALGGLATMAAGQGQKLMDNPPPDNFIRRSYAAVTIIGDYVYVDGGEMSQKLGDKTLPPDEAHTLVNSTLSFNISTSWETSKVNILAYDKPAPKLSRQVLWKGKDPNVFWIWGGRTIRRINRDEIDKETIWRFVANGKGGGDWSSEIPSGSDDFDDMHLPSRSSYTTYENMGFSLGGELIPDSDPEVEVEMQPVEGMITFDLESKTFSNKSTPDVSPYGNMIGSTVEYVPDFGDNGLIMVFGGFGYTLDVGSRPPEHTRRFDNITMFDPKTREWYWQMSTGDIPPPRLDHCSVGVKSGRDTYEIFVFGGYDPTNARTWDTLYVLSLPGFVWKAIDAKSGGPRSGQACVATGNRQMLSIGGINTHMEKPWEDKDAFNQGIGVFDMTELKWQKHYNHKADPYDSPEPVKDWYAGGGLDGVKWSSKGVEALFTGVTPDVPKKDNTPVGAIAGGVVGGVAGASLIGVLVWWLLRRKRKADAGGYAPAQHEMDGAAKPTELPPHGQTPYGQTQYDQTHYHQPHYDGAHYNHTPEPAPSELASKQRSPPAELDTPVAELDGSSQVPHRIV